MGVKWYLTEVSICIPPMTNNIEHLFLSLLTICISYLRGKKKEYLNPLPLSQLGYLPFQLRWWLSGKESACQCSRHTFSPWVRKIPWRRKWQPTPVFLPGKSHGQRNLVGYSPWSRKESDIMSKQPLPFYWVVRALSSCLFLKLQSRFPLQLDLHLN